ncbi:hypothetical protein NIES4075_70800 [Tolypothrix sp. NIES-4075]|uniref:hypothetical protein n=1 Tax=Tolypothrix sp. NIES-4075 TaxID=2005459 RepID=UPI000B5C34EF|nr:hypothetical protein [Tolypothrix sp. NIES-4075]GAX46059.1 hypothetical protein NIES4075_70800 [Tolypothrix sp. NIES-4075]
MAQGETSIRVYLKPEAKDRFKTTCFLKGLNMSDIAAELIEDWLVKNAVDLPTPQTKKSSSQTKKREEET